MGDRKYSGRSVKRTRELGSFSFRLVLVTLLLIVFQNALFAVAAEKTSKVVVAGDLFEQIEEYSSRVSDELKNELCEKFAKACSGQVRVYDLFSRRSVYLVVSFTGSKLWNLTFLTQYMTLGSLQSHSNQEIVLGAISMHVIVEEKIPSDKFEPIEVTSEISFLHKERSVSLMIYDFFPVTDGGHTLDLQTKATNGWQATVLQQNIYFRETERSTDK